MKYISGIRPTGRLHLGNYIGSILPAIKYDSDVLIAELHAPEGDAQALFDDLKKYFSGTRLIRQKYEFRPEIYFKLLQVTPTGLLKHMPQYKEKDKNALMFTYPVLMAHDIVGYDKVIVGDDQKPHIELAKDILHKIGETCPEPIYEGGRVMDLRHPDRKMSKSTPESCLFLDDSEETIRKKVKAAVTTPEGRANLEFIFNALDDCGCFGPPELNSDLKTALADLIIRRLNEHRKSN